MKREWTVLCDTREKRALPLPSTLVVKDWGHFYPGERTTTVRIQTEEVALTTGDYCLKGHESTCLIERKGSLRELEKNLMDSQDRERFFNQLRRLRASTRNPVLFVEGDPLSWHQKRTDKINPHLLRDCLLGSCLQFGVQLVLLPCNSVGARRAAAEWLISTLIACVHQDPLPSNHAPATLTVRNYVATLPRTPTPEELTNGTASGHDAGHP